MKTPVSGTMIVRDEEAGIERAILSIQQIEAVQEVVVVDTGSEDRTIETARDLGARVFEEVWSEDFSKHRNSCLDLCTYDWVFVIDGDEELVDPGDIDAALGQSRVDGLAVTIACEARGEVQEQFMAIRLFRRSRARWKYPVHEQPVGLRNPAATTARIVAHYDEDFRATARRRLQTLLDGARRHPGDAHYLFFIAKTYRALYDLDATRTWAERFLRLKTGDVREAEAAVWLVEAAFHRGDVGEAQRICRRGLKQHPRYPDLLHLQMTLAALRWYRHSVEIDPRYLGAACRTPGYAGNLKEVISLLRLPLGFSEEG